MVAVDEDAPFKNLEVCHTQKIDQVAIPQAQDPARVSFDLVSVCMIKIDWRGLALAWLGFDVSELPLRPIKLRFRFRLVVCL